MRGKGPGRGRDKGETCGSPGLKMAAEVRKRPRETEIRRRTRIAYLFYSTYIFLCLMYPNLASEHGKLRLSLRGGQDPKLIAEALRDLKRMEKGQLPLFVEHMFDGYDDDLTCNDPNFEARPPPTLGSTSAMSDERMDRRQEQKTPVLTQEEEDRLDRERAKKHFEEVDAKFFYPHENVVSDPQRHLVGADYLQSHMYPPNIPQRRTFPEDPLERYKECRRYAQQIRHYLKASRHRAKSVGNVNTFRNRHGSSPKISTSKFGSGNTTPLSTKYA
eukprot:766099-Hanusia_phi.AAC.1